MEEMRARQPLETCCSSVPEMRRFREMEYMKPTMLSLLNDDHTVRIIKIFAREKVNYFIGHSSAAFFISLLHFSTLFINIFNPNGIFDSGRFPLRRISFYSPSV